MTTARDENFRWRVVLMIALLPTFVYAIGTGSIIPLIPTVATRLGSDIAGAGLVAALVTVGTVSATLPGAWIVQRLGERNAMILASATSAIAAAVAALSTNVVVLGASLLVFGASSALMGLARLSFTTMYIPLTFRARALSSVGGVNRAGDSIGPFLAAAIVSIVVQPQLSFWAHVVCCAIAIIVLLAVRDPALDLRPAVAAKSASSDDGADVAATPSPGVFAIIRTRWPVLVRIGSGAMMVTAVRQARIVLVPLWAVSIGLSAAETALIIGIAGAVDFALFYTGGQIMDRWGRLWTAVPCMLGMGLGLLTLSFTHDLEANVIWFITIAMIMSVANGLGSGLVMTLGADLSDARNPASFLGVWRFITELGGALAPLAVAGITFIASISVATGAIGVLGVIGAGLLGRYIPRYAPHRRAKPEPKDD